MDFLKTSDLTKSSSWASVSSRWEMAQIPKQQARPWGARHLPQAGEGTRCHTHTRGHAWTQGHTHMYTHAYTCIHINRSRTLSVHIRTPHVYAHMHTQACSLAGCLREQQVAADFQP